MLKQRLITALVLIPFIIWAIFAASPLLFNIGVALLIIYAAWEWTRLMGWDSPIKQCAYLGFIAALILIFPYSNVYLVLSLAALFWLHMLFWLYQYPNSTELWARNTVLVPWGAMILVPCWLSIATLRETPMGPQLILYLFVLIWAADTGAYFAGKQFGKHKLAPNLSPGKTLEGVLGGLLTAMLIAVIGGLYFGLTPMKFFTWLALAIVTALISVAGDITISMFKRNQGMKDSGSIVPGHGGLLDRIDSLTAAAPIFVLGLLVFGI